MAFTEEIADCLRQLGSTRKQVAETLLANRVQGVRNIVRTLNPVIRFLQICLKNEALDMDVIPGDTLRCRFRKKEDEVPLPKPVMQFLDVFNGGKHPELELPPKTV